jgi:hypothetical protein
MSHQAPYRLYYGSIDVHFEPEFDTVLEEIVVAAPAAVAEVDNVVPVVVDSKHMNSMVSGAVNVSVDDTGFQVGYKNFAIDALFEAVENICEVDSVYPEKIVVAYSHISCLFFICVRVLFSVSISILAQDLQYIRCKPIALH